MEGFNGPIEGLPELIDACNGKESVFTAVVGQVLQSSQIAQVGLHVLTPKAQHTFTT